jgi:hypothetical protein
MNENPGDFSASGAATYATFCSVISTAKARQRITP